MSAARPIGWQPPTDNFRHARTAGVPHPSPQCSDRTPAGNIHLAGCQPTGTTLAPNRQSALFSTAQPEARQGPDPVRFRKNDAKEEDDTAGEPIVSDGGWPPCYCWTLFFLFTPSCIETIEEKKVKRRRENGTKNRQRGHTRRTPVGYTDDFSFEPVAGPQAVVTRGRIRSWHPGSVPGNVLGLGPRFVTSFASRFVPASSLERTAVLR